VGCLLDYFVVRVFALDAPPPAPADGGHCREMAGKLRELARPARTPLMRWELADLARRYDLRGDHFDRRAG